MCRVIVTVKNCPSRKEERTRHCVAASGILPQLSHCFPCLLAPFSESSGVKVVAEAVLLNPWTERIRHPNEKGGGILAGGIVAGMCS